jgi:hypothetical protein
VVDALADLELGTITVANLTATTADINGGTIDGVTIGGSSAGAGTFSGLTVAASVPTINFEDTDGNTTHTIAGGGNGDLNISVDPTDTGTNSSNFRVSVDGKTFQQIDATGDISFYEDTGTTPKFFWDASEESLNIGTTSGTADRRLHITGAGPSTAASQFGIVANPSYPTSVTTNVFNLYTGPNLTSGTTLTNLYNLYLEANNITGSTVTNSFGLYQAGSGDKNYFAGNVGIGTSSPARPLEVLGSGDTLVRITGGSGNAKGIEFYKGSGTATQLYNVSDDLRIFTNAAERMRIDDSGNLGLGVTPSAWSWRALQVGSFGGFFATNSAAYASYLGNNAYYNGTNWVYLASSGAVHYELAGGDGAHKWYTAPSGTAGNTISFTQAMTLDASGRLQIATTNSSATNTKLVAGAGLASTDGVIVANTANGNYAALTLSNWDGTATTQGPRLVFDNSGRGFFVIGGSDGANNFDICRTWGTPDVRIDSSGNLLVGTTSSTVANPGVVLYPSGQQAIGHANGTASGTAFSSFLYNNGVIGSISQNGTTAVLYNTSSDARLKENIADAEDAGAKVDAIQVRQFDWKADGSHQDYGMIAQELMTVAPEAVSGDPESDDMMGVDYSKLVPMLVKEIQSLRARVHALEGK